MCVLFVALGIEHATRMRRFVICDPAPLNNIFSKFLIKDKIFEKKD